MSSENVVILRRLPACTECRVCISMFSFTLISGCSSHTQLIVRQTVPLVFPPLIISYLYLMFYSWLAPGVALDLLSCMHQRSVCTLACTGEFSTASGRVKMRTEFETLFSCHFLRLVLIITLEQRASINVFLDLSLTPRICIRRSSSQAFGMASPLLHCHLRLLHGRFSRWVLYSGPTLISNCPKRRP